MRASFLGYGTLAAVLLTLSCTAGSGAPRTFFTDAGMPVIHESPGKAGDDPRTGHEPSGVRHEPAGNGYDPPRTGDTSRDGGTQSGGSNSTDGGVSVRDASSPAPIDASDMPDLPRDGG